MSEVINPEEVWKRMEELRDVRLPALKKQYDENDGELMEHMIVDCLNILESMFYIILSAKKMARNRQDGFYSLTPKQDSASGENE